MSVNLATQIRDYAAELDAAQDPVTFDELAEVRVSGQPVRLLMSRTEGAGSPSPGRIVLVTAGFAIAVLLLVGGAVWLTQARPGLDVVDQPTNTNVKPDQTTSVPVFGAAEALAVADAYFTAYNEGDVEAVKRLFATDAEFATNLGPEDRAEWEQVLAWNAAQGTVLTRRDCRVDDEDSGISVTLYCPHDNLDALVQAVGADPVPINLTLIVTPSGVEKWTFLFGPPDFNVVGRPFGRWMANNHPDEAATVGFGNWASIEEAEQNGILTAQYAAAWAAYLTENDCTYKDGC
jgi:hypothetical protein